ncbi:MAG: hypothetical protein M2R46_04863 [Verrucomicrobia subdivision 3 bacterium]|nr:hypothetical protein [Limisphaerales bacterium]
MDDKITAVCILPANTGFDQCHQGQYRAGSAAEICGCVAFYYDFLLCE